MWGSSQAGRHRVTLNRSLTLWSLHIREQPEYEGLNCDQYRFEVCWKHVILYLYWLYIYIYLEYGTRIWVIIEDPTVQADASYARRWPTVQLRPIPLKARAENLAIKTGVLNVSCRSVYHAHRRKHCAHATAKARTLISL